MVGVETAEDEGQKESEGEAGVSWDSDVERENAVVGVGVAFGIVVREGGGEGVLEGDREGDILVVDMDIVFRP